MKKKRLMFLILIIMLLTACKNKELTPKNIQYDLKITDTYNEKIDIALSKDAYEIAEEYSEQKGEYISDEYKLLKKDIYPVNTSSIKKYKKTIKKYSNLVDVKLSYNYTEKDFINEGFIYRCFENYDLVRADDYFELYLSGNFYCLTGFNEVNINIDTINEVLESNGNKKNDIYNWVINKENKDNVNIYYKIVRDYDSMPNKINNKKGTKIILRLVRIIIVVVVSYIIIKILKKYQND